MFKKLIAGTTLICCSALVNASFVEQTATIGVSTTDIVETKTLNQFDDLGGSLLLQSVTITMDGMISGIMRAESLDTTESVITSELNATLSINGLETGLFSDSLNIVNTFNATAYDGETDWGGTSGVTYDNLGGALSDSAVFTDATTLESFTGTGTFDFIFSAIATTLATGPGNITSSHSMTGGGTFVITYDFLEAQLVNAPASIAFIMSGLLAILFVKRKA